jgi:hypothetical protein
MLNQTQLAAILDEAQGAARAASAQHIIAHGEGPVCGFAWVNIYQFKGQKIKGNTRLGRLLKSVGVSQDYTRVFSQWCNWYGGQSVDVKESGARAFAEVLREYGFDAYAGSRLD